MAGDPRLLIAFSKALQQCAGNGLHLLDRDGLLAIHRALMTVKDEIERELAQRPDDWGKPN
jgi:hypothetical protein